MSRALVVSTQPTVTFTLTININADRSLLLLAGLLWLAWLTLGGVVRRIRHLYEIGRAAVVVAWRRLKRAIKRLESRIEWGYSGLVYGPVCGVG